MPAADTSAQWLPVWATAYKPQDLSVLAPHLLTTSDSTSRLFRNTTLRQTVEIGLDVDRIRLRFSNELCRSPLLLTRVTMALAAKDERGDTYGSRALEPASRRDVTFSTYSSIAIPPNGYVQSDPIDLKIRAGENISVSIYLRDGQEGTIFGGHNFSRSDSFLVQGDHVEDECLPSESSTSITRWFFLIGVEALVESSAFSVACVGDSITNIGHNAIARNTHHTWPDYLIRRLASEQSTFAGRISVLNMGNGGDQVWKDGLSRAPRDILTRRGVRHVLLFMGVNDLGQTPATTEAQDDLYRRMTLAYSQIADMMHENGIKVSIGTITPFTPPNGWEPRSKYVHPLREEARLKVNEWIRSSDKFDHVMDFASALCRKDNPHMLQAEYQNRDYLHPSPAGGKALAEAVGLDMFR